MAACVHTYFCWKSISSSPGPYFPVSVTSLGQVLSEHRGDGRREEGTVADAAGQLCLPRGMPCVLGAISTGD